MNYEEAYIEYFHKMYGKLVNKSTRKLSYPNAIEVSVIEDKKPSTEIEVRNENYS